MMTDLPAGTFFAFRYKGDWDHGQVCVDQNSYTLMTGAQVPADADVHVCVWKGKRLESRRVRKGPQPTSGRDSWR